MELDGFVRLALSNPNVLKKGFDEKGVREILERKVEEVRKRHKSDLAYYGSFEALVDGQVELGNPMSIMSYGEHRLIGSNYTTRRNKDSADDPDLIPGLVPAVLGRIASADEVNRLRRQHKIFHAGALNAMSYAKMKDDDTINRWVEKGLINGEAVDDAFFYTLFRMSLEEVDRNGIVTRRPRIVEVDYLGTGLDPNDFVLADRIDGILSYSEG